MIRNVVMVSTAALLCGCASTYDLTLMPRTSGALYRGEAVQAAGSSEAQVSIVIDGRQYTGTWLLTARDYGARYVSAGIGFGGRRGGFGMVTAPVLVDNTASEAKALLRAADGSGLRCDLKGVAGGHGSGTCQDDNGLLYDVQIRTKENK